MEGGGKGDREGFVPYPFLENVVAFVAVGVGAAAVNRKGRDLLVFCSYVLDWPGVIRISVDSNGRKYT